MATKRAGQEIKKLGRVLNFGKAKVPAEVFHRQIKPNILNNAGNFSKLVGKNPDIKIIGNKIRLIGNGPFKGKSFDTGLEIVDFFGDFTK